MKPASFYLNYLLFSFLFLGLIGCAAAPDINPTAASQITPVESAMRETKTPLPTSTPALTPTFLIVEPTPKPTSASVEPIIESVEPMDTAVTSQLIVANTNGIFAIAHGGYAITQLVSGPIAVGGDVNGQLAAFSPDGRYFAYNTVSPSYEPTALHLLDIKTGENWPITSLLSEETESRPEDDCLGEDNYSNRCQAVFTVGEIAWSPDSLQLAFVSAHAGDSSDVYLYTLADQQIRQLTSGPTAASQLYWSPDSQVIFHYGVEFSAGSGSESIKSGWAVRTDGTNAINLHEELHSQQETIVGWHDTETVVVYSMDVGFCGFDLRAHNVHTGKTTTLWDGTFAAHGAAMQPKGNLLLETTCPLKDNGFLHLLTLPQGESILVSDVLPHFPIEPRWSGLLEAFYSRNDSGWQLFSIDGKTSSYSMLGIDRSDSIPPDAIPGASYWAWTGDQNSVDLSQNVWLQSMASDSNPQLIFTGHAYYLTWNPAGDTIFFLGGNNPPSLYAAKAPTFAPFPVTTDELFGSYWNVVIGWSSP